MAYTSEDEFMTASEKAYRTIREKILDGELSPGTKLSQRKMAALAGVSIIPVIEALVRLSNDGLVEYRPQWGARVTMLTREKLEDFSCFREAVECQVARVLSQKLTDGQERELRAIAAELDTLRPSAAGTGRFWELDCLFHAKMAAFTEFPSFSDALQRINLFQLMTMTDSKAEGEREMPGDWHMRVVAAIASRDENEAERVMRLHVRDIMNNKAFQA